MSLYRLSQIGLVALALSFGAGPTQAKAGVKADKEKAREQARLEQIRAKARQEARLRLIEEKKEKAQKDLEKRLQAEKATQEEKARKKEAKRENRLARERAEEQAQKQREEAEAQRAKAEIEKKQAEQRAREEEKRKAEEAKLQKTREKEQKRAEQEKAREEEQKRAEQEKASIEVAERKAKEKEQKRAEQERAREEEQKRVEQEKASKEAAKRKAEEEAQKKAEQEKARKEAAELKAKEEEQKKAEQEKASKEAAKRKAGEEEQNKAEQEKARKEAAERKAREEEERRVAREQAKQEALKRSQEAKEKKEREDKEKALAEEKANLQAVMRKKEEGKGKFPTPLEPGKGTRDREIEQMKARAKARYDQELVRIDALGKQWAEEETARRERAESGVQLKTNEERMAAARAAYHAGRPEAAQAILSEIGKGKAIPSGFDALNNKVSSAVQERAKELKSLEDQVQKAPTAADSRFKLGFLYYGLGRYQDGVRQYEALVQQTPNDACSQVNLGYGLERTGGTDKAEQAYRAALRLRPDMAEAQVHLAHLLASQKRSLPEAVELAKKGLSAMPKDPDAMHALGLAYLQSGMIPEALEVLAAASRKSNADEMLLHYGTALAQAGKLAQACLVLDKAAQAGGQFAGAAKTLQAELANRKGAAERKAREEEEGKGKSPTSLESGKETCSQKIEQMKAQAKVKYEQELARIDALAKQQEEEEKAQKERAASAAQLEKAEARMAAAQAAYQAGRPEAALAILSEIGKAKALPSGFDALNSKVSGAVQERAKELKSLEDQVQKTPTAADSRFKLGFLYYGLGRHQDGVRQYEAIVQQTPNDAYSQVNLGYGLERTGSADKAEQAYRAALKLRPDMAEAQVHLAHLLASQKKSLPEAVELGKKGRSTMPKDPDAMHALGLAYLQSGMLPEALDLLAAASSKAGSDEMFLHYGTALAQAGKLAQAYLVLDKAVQSGGQFAEAAKALQVELAK
jgi:tetratricopeptide (TPR) repeat protein